MSTRSASGPRGLRPCRGLTFIEVVIAASILAIAALAVLELLSSSDRVGLFARRQALAAMEAERILELSAESVKAGTALPSGDALQAGMRGEALGGCVLSLTATDRLEDFVIPPAGPQLQPVTQVVKLRMLVATVATPDGEQIVQLERVVPVDDN